SGAPRHEANAAKRGASADRRQRHGRSPCHRKPRLSDPAPRLPNGKQFRRSPYGGGRRSEKYRKGNRERTRMPPGNLTGLRSQRASAPETSLAAMATEDG